jgi:hypothetical protein
MRRRAAPFLLAGIALACSSTTDAPEPLDASLSDAPVPSDTGDLRDTDSDAHAPADASADEGADAPVDASADEGADAPIDGTADARAGADGRSDSPASADGDARSGADGNTFDSPVPTMDAPSWDGGFADCTVLPPLPPTTSTMGRLWFTSSRVLGVVRSRERDGVIYGAANPPFRLDALTSSLCFFPAPAADEQTQDILAPVGSSLVSIAYGSDGPRVDRTSADDGRTWSTARGPGRPAHGGGSRPSELAALPSVIGPPARLFATCGGTTLDISENGGLDWTRVVEGGGTGSAGFAVDSAGETLWYLSEAVPDRVAAYWMAIPASGPLSSMWNFKLLPEWDSNHVWIAQADPFDPHAMYLGGDGRLGYLTTPGGEVTIDLPWNLPRLPTPGDLFILVQGLWVDPLRDKHVIWGGGNTMSSARLLESTEGGRNAQEIPLEGPPAGWIVGVHRLPALAKLVVIMERPADRILAAYVLDR